MTTIKTQDLTGAALDYMTAVAIGRKAEITQFFAPTGVGGQDAGASVWCKETDRPWTPTSSSSQCMPLISDYQIEFMVWDGDWVTASIKNVWPAAAYEAQGHFSAACRAIVAAKLGDEVDVPEELV